MQIKKIDKIKKRILLLITINFLILTYASFSTFISIKNNNNLEKERASLIGRLDSLNKNIKINHQLLEDYQGAERISEELESNSEESDEFKINKAKSLLFDLGKLYNLSNLSTKFSDSEEIKGVVLKGEKILMHSDVEIKVSSYSDEEIYKFIDSIDRFFPGFIKLNYVEINKNVTMDNYQDFIENGKILEMVSAYIKLSWHDFKSLATN